jgi:hypothetical protein
MAIPAIISAVGLAAQLGGSIYSAVKSKKANEEKEKAIREKDRIAQELYEQQISNAETLNQSEGNFMETAQGKGLVTQLNDQYDDAIQDATANGIKGGQTEEAKIAQTQAANKNYTNSFNQIGQLGTNYRLGILNQVNSLKNNAMTGRANAAINKQTDLYNLAEERNQSALNLGENVNQASSNITNAGLNIW